MSQPVDQLLTKRAGRATTGTSSLAFSLIFHGAVATAAWFVPELLAKPPEPVEYFNVIVVPPQVLGIEKPPPPPPPPPRVEPPPPEPPPPEPPPPEPEPVADVPVLPDKKKKVEKKPPPPKAKPKPSPPPPPAPPPKRVGSPFGNPLGATSQQATLGVEDPNFTYGYYLDRIVAVISSNWLRPAMGNLEARLHFRIQRNGTITDLRIVKSSEAREFDDAALRAVNASSPLPPLPKGYSEDDLGINLLVK